MQRSRCTSRWSLLVVLIPTLAIHAGWNPHAWAGSSFVVTNLVTNDQAANTAQITDSHLVNAWGISYGPTSPFWVSDNGTGLSTLYSVDPITNATTKLGLAVNIPGMGASRDRFSTARRRLTATDSCS